MNFNDTLGKVNEKEVRIKYLIFLFHKQLKLSVDFFQARADQVKEKKIPTKTQENYRWLKCKSRMFILCVL